MAKIESSDKNNFIKDLMPDDNLYRIDGQSKYVFGPWNPTEEGYEFYDRTPMSYFNWDTALKDKTIAYISIRNDGKWVSTPRNSEYFVLEYKAKKLSDFFINPRVYYQVLGSEE